MHACNSQCHHRALVHALRDGARPARALVHAPRTGACPPGLAQPCPSRRYLQYLNVQLHANNALDKRSIQTAFHHFTDRHQRFHINQILPHLRHQAVRLWKALVPKKPFTTVLAPHPVRTTHPALILHAYASYAAIVQQPYPVAIVSLYERMIANHPLHRPAWLHHLSSLPLSKTNRDHHYLFSLEPFPIASNSGLTLSSSSATITTPNNSLTYFCNKCTLFSPTACSTQPQSRSPITPGR